MKSSYFMACVGKDYGMSDKLVVELIPQMRYYNFVGFEKHKAIQIMKIAHCNVVFNPQKGKTIPCKTFEALASCTPILYITNSLEKDETWELLEKYSDRAFCCLYNKQDIKRALGALIGYENKNYKEPKEWKVVKKGWWGSCLKT